MYLLFYIFNIFALIFNLTIIITTRKLFFKKSGIDLKSIFQMTTVRVSLHCQLNWMKNHPLDMSVKALP